MTPQAMADYVRYRCRVNSTTLTNANLLILFNVVKNDICQRALEIDEDIWLMPTYMNLVATQREYPLHSNLLSRIKRVEAKLDSTNFIKLYSFDLTDHDYPVTPEANITAHFANEEGNAFYDILRNAITIYSGTITAVTAGLRIWQNMYPADFTDMTSVTDASVDPSTTTLGVPKPLHKVICEGVIIEWKGALEKPIPLTDNELLHERNIQKALQTLKKASYDTEVTGSLPSSVQSFGGDGFDL